MENESWNSISGVFLDYGAMYRCVSSDDLYPFYGVCCMVGRPFIQMVKVIIQHVTKIRKLPYRTRLLEKDEAAITETKHG